MMFEMGYVVGDPPTGRVTEVDFFEAMPFLHAEIISHGKTEFEAKFVLDKVQALVEQGHAIITMDEASKVYVGIATV